MKKILFLFVLCALALSSCEGTANQVETLVGNQFEITTLSNPGTGYHWELISELDEDLVEFVSKDYAPDLPQTPGSGGTDVWVFKALAKGKTTLTFGYFPPEVTVTPEQTLEFTVAIK